MENGVINMKCFEVIPGVGERVDELRIRNNESVAALARVIGVSASYTSRLLKDKKQWGFDQIKDAANHYNVSVEYICTGSTKLSPDFNNNDYEILLGDVVIFLENLPLEEKKRNCFWLIKELIDSLSNDQK